MESFVPLQAKSCACPQPEIIANSICEILNQTTPFCTPPQGSVRELKYPSIEKVVVVHGAKWWRNN